MCIRDRGGRRLRIQTGTQRHFAQIQRRIALHIRQSIGQCLRGLYALEPVSYTHLDVYKRQPDSGPMHIANAMGSKVLGLHAATNPERSGPYSDRRYCVNRYDDAARKYRGQPASSLKWGSKIEADGVMDLVTVDDAIAAFERYRSDFC